MKAIVKTALMATALFGMASPSMANPIASPALNAPVNVTGQITVVVLGLVTATCNITMTGTVTSVGTSTVPGVVTFTSGTATDLPGKSDCNSSSTGAVSYPIIARATSTSVVTIDQLKLTTPIGTCTKNNATVAWNNATAGGTISTNAGICTSLTGTLQTVSTPIVIS